MGLGVTIGRRISELLDGHARLEPATAWSVTFTGQRKHRGNREDFAFEIPTLAPAADVLEAWERLQVMLGDQVLDPQTINNRYGHQVNQAAKRHFHGLVPTRLHRATSGEGKDQVSDPLAQERRGDALYLHLFRAVYATIAVHWFCPPRVNRLVYKAEIQGHRQILDAPTATMRRSYAASRHYDDYQIADASGENIDGRQGTKLGVLPGLEVLRAFQPPSRRTEPAPAPAILPATPDDTFLSPNPPAIAMDPSTSPAAADDELPAASPTPSAEPSGTAAEAAATPKAKKPRPGTYRIHQADRPRLDAFRGDPKQSQADNLQDVITRAEEAAQALQAHQKTLRDLEAAREGAEQAEQAHAQVHQEAETLRSQHAAQGEELQRLQQAFEQERARAAAVLPPPPPPPAAAAGSALATAALARELLALATGSECPPSLQASLIALATQALGGPAVPATYPVAPANASTKRSAKAPLDPVRYGPLFATGGQDPHAIVAVDGAASIPHKPSTGTQTPLAGGVEAVAPGAGPDQVVNGTQEPPGAMETPPTAPTILQVDRRRGGAADKLARALTAVLAHNQAQSAREHKWALTETAIARLTGCFRPAVRRFFAEHAQEVEEHNARHHLTGGHNAARGKRGETIEGEIAWRDTPEPANPHAGHTAANV